MPQFYVVETTMASDHRLFAGGQWVNDERRRCPLCGMFLEGSEPAIIEIALNHLGSYGFAEYLWNSHSLPIFREDVVKLWKESKLTGFEAKPVRIVGWYEDSSKPLPVDIPRYFRIVVTSKVRLTPSHNVMNNCSRCNVVQYMFPSSGRMTDGLDIDTVSWDGSDLFALRGYDFMFCTYRVAHVTLAAGFNKQVAFVRVSDWGTWEEFSVARWKPREYKMYLEGFLRRSLKQLDGLPPEKQSREEANILETGESP